MGRIIEGSKQYAWVLAAGFGILTTRSIATGPPHIMGAWSPAFVNQPEPYAGDIEWNPEHMIVLKNGKVLLIREWFGDQEPTSLCQLFSPAGYPLDNPSPADLFGEVFDGPSVANTGRLHDLNCAGHSQMADGSVLFVGGTTQFSTVYNPDVLPNGQWIAVANSVVRYYPTCTTLQDGRVLVVGGRCNWWSPAAANTPMIFDPNPPSTCGNPPSQCPHWTPLTGAEYCDPIPPPQGGYSCPVAANNFHIKYYPFNFLHSCGKVLSCEGDDEAYFAPTSQFLGPKTRLLNYQTRGSWTDVATESFRGESAVMFRPDKIMRAGGEVPPNPQNPPLCNEFLCPFFHCGFCEGMTDTNQVSVMDATGKLSTWAWTPIAPLNDARSNFYLIALPNGEVLAVGGTTKAAGGNGDHQCGDYIYRPEIYDPDDPNAVWRLMNSHTRPRGYHSTAVLLPDARVLVAGHLGNDDPVPADNPNVTAEIFSPPYLFNSDDSIAIPRPAILGVSGADENVIAYGKSFNLDTAQAADITKVSLIGLGAATHSFDHNQRFVPLEFEYSPPDRLYVAPPAHACLAPPGYYMLFIVNRDGVPSKAAMVKLE